MNGWFLLLAPVDGVLTHLLAIRREESHLIALFGYQYEDLLPQGPALDLSISARFRKTEVRSPSRLRC
jgi:hypothetical protein